MNATSTLPEAEEEIAADPVNPNALVAVISDFSQRGGYNETKYSYSLNGGASWTQSFVPRTSSGLLATSNASWDSNSDPTVAIDRQGNVYLSNLYLNVSNNASGVYVSVANITSGLHFSAAHTFPIKSDLNPNSTVQEDKPWITVDNNLASPYLGRVYEVWTHFTLSSSWIFFSRSTDHGAHWSSALKVSAAWQDNAVQAGQVATGPHGEIYIVYELFLAHGKRQQFVTKSTDGGSHFSAPVAISPQFNEVSFAASYRINSYPALAVNPVSGVEYVLYASEPSTTVGAQIEFIRSTAAGVLTFTSPTAINDVATGQQFFPAISADINGTIAASWFDTRNSPGSASHYDVYATRSSNNGNSFAPNARVTRSLVDAGSAGFIGDYSGIVAAGGEAHPVWTSGGFNNGKLQTATLH